MLEARIDRAAVSLRAAVDWILKVSPEPCPTPEPELPAWQRLNPARPSARERSARECLLVLLRDGDLHATGRYSDTPGAPWESPHPGRQWMMHSGRHTQIVTETWREGRYKWDHDSLDLREGQFIDILVPRFMITTLWPAQPNRDAVSNGSITYTTPYLELMRRAIAELRISATSQPKKETVMAWFREQAIDQQPISENFARHLATFVRLPESQRGGNRKWRDDEEEERAAAR